MRPGKPVMFGFLRKQRIISLPGNPASAIICARVFLKPLLDRLSRPAHVEGMARGPALPWPLKQTANASTICVLSLSQGGSRSYRANRIVR